MSMMKLVDGVLTEMTAEDISQRELDIAAWEAQADDRIRKERNTLIASTDWWATSDRTMSAEQTAYRQALRDITSQAGFPTDITWPTKPEEV